MMNKKLISIVLALSIPLTAIAGQGPQSDFERPHGQKIERLTRELGLGADQKTKVESLFKEQKEKYKALHEETRGQLQKILTPEQMTKLDEIHKRHHGHRGGPKDPAKPE
jgi:Spy/CpxP family protein refolding chaperone